MGSFKEWWNHPDTRRLHGMFGNRQAAQEAWEAAGRMRPAILAMTEEWKALEAERDKTLARVAALEHHNAELKKCIEAGQRAHLDDRGRADWLARDRDKALARVVGLGLENENLTLKAQGAVEEMEEIADERDAYGRAICEWAAEVGWTASTYAKQPHVKALLDIARDLEGGG